MKTKRKLLYVAVGGVLLGTIGIYQLSKRDAPRGEGEPVVLETTFEGVPPEQVGQSDAPFLGQTNYVPYESWTITSPSP